MPGKTQYWPFGAAPRPEIVHLAEAQVFQLKTAGSQTVAHQLLTAGIIGRRRVAGDQIAGEGEGSRKLGHGDFAVAWRLRHDNRLARITSVPDWVDQGLGGWGQRALRQARRCFLSR